MKKLLLASVPVLALSAGAAFAQSNPAETGKNVAPGSDAVIQQIGSGNNISTFNQTVSDSSSANYSEIFQGSTSGNTSSAGGTVSMTQLATSGAANSSRVYQTGNIQTATITQNSLGSGSFVSSIEQTGGSNNTVTVSQGVLTFNADGTVATNTAITGGAYSGVLQQGTNGQVTVNQTAAGVSSTVQQTAGDKNLASVTQASVGASSTITQSGSGDGTTINATVKQSSGSGNASFIGQSGYDDYVLVNQAGGGTDNSSVTQSGQLDQANVLQYSMASSSAITQSGKSDQATVHQWAGSNVSGITQTGGTDVATVLQSGNTSGVSYITQAGMADQASVTQYGATSNNSSISQLDLNDYAIVNQGGLAGYNSSGINQGGGGNGGNIATIMQTANYAGSQNLSSITQGGGATATVTQTVNNGAFINNSGITQNGQNTVTVTQDAEDANNSSTINQSLSAAGSTTNTILLSQTSNLAANASNITQSGFNNYVKVTQK